MSAPDQLARRPWRRLALGAAVVVGVLGAALLFVRFAVGWVFPIESTSMWPTLRPGEWVFLRWDRSLPERFDLVAFRSDTGDALVKRVWGVSDEGSRESVLIEPAGDVLIDGQLRYGPGRPAPVVVFDSRVDDVEAAFAHGEGDVDPWARVTLDDGEVAYELDARGLPPRHPAAVLRHRLGVRDDQPGPRGTRVPGTINVNDLVLAAEVFVVEGGGVLRLELREQGDRLEFALDLPRAAGPATGRLHRLRGDVAGPSTTRPFDVPVGRWFRVTFSNVDNELVAEVDDQPPLRSSYVQNTPHVEDVDGDGRVDDGDLAPGGEGADGAALAAQGGALTDAATSFGERALLGADGAVVRFRRITLARDIHVPAVGEHGVGRELRLGPGKVYVLGDNPTHSRDSREFGPVSKDRLIGRPTRVVWPPSAWRRL